MIIGKQFRNKDTQEVVLEEDSRDYALEQLGIMHNNILCINLTGKNGELTKDQYEMLDMLVEWYYSGAEWEVEDIVDDYNDNDYEIMNGQEYYRVNLFN